MIKAVIFDLDGTLLNRDASLQKFIENQYDRLNKEFHHVLKEKYVSRFIELDCRGYVWKDKVYQQIVDEFNITSISRERLLDDYISEFQKSCIPFPNLIDILEALKRDSIHLGLITNGKGQFQMNNIRALEIEGYFETILISEYEGMKKPDRKIFVRALNQLGVSANESIYIGDHPENDVKGAEKAGMVGVWKRDLAFSNVKAKYIIDDLSEIPPIIQELNQQ
ncbi:HAD family hydrolase [Oceanobacillus kapialis]|uniref:HAD family hydrolase n=1 Tax=Oceanobacillus kapialis TaxID=481353 RepID=UPI00384E2A98